MSKYKDVIFMKKVLKLARGRERKTMPNPSVACIVVKKDKIVSKSVHKGSGHPHAERIALEKAGRDAAGSTLYVNLEPCCHWGKTPPCTEKIIESKVKRVVYAIRDPNALVCGKGRSELEKAGIEVSAGVCAEEGFEINEHFFVSCLFERPFVSLKFATSADGFARDKNGSSKWITGEKARSYGRKLRALHVAVTAGTNTVLADNPFLTARLPMQIDPLRVIIDRVGKIPENSNVFLDENYIVFTSNENYPLKAELIEKDRFGISAMLEILYKKYNVRSLLVEGGPAFAASFVKNSLYDCVYHFIAPIFLGEGLGMMPTGFSLEEHPHLSRKAAQYFGEDLLVVYKNPLNRIKIAEDGCLQV